MDNSTYKKKDYVASQAVQQAGAELNAHTASKPGAYSSKYQQHIYDTINKILNREKFSYDLNGDALYQQYKDQYATQGKLAMMNTMGQAAALTGGYGSSYSQAAGQQAYQGYLQELNNIVPELYRMAYDKYNQEGQDMYNRYSMLSTQDQADYGKYRDTVSDYYNERDYLASRYDSERNFDYGKYVDDVNFDYSQFVDDRNYNYQLSRDEVADAQWEQSFAYQKEQDAIVNAHNKAQLDESIRQWKENFTYQKEMDANDIAYRDKVYADTVAQQKLDNEYREATRQDGINSENRSYAYDTVMALIMNGAVVSDELLAAAGLSRSDETALSSAYQAAAAASKKGAGLSISEFDSIVGKASDIAENNSLESAGKYLDMMVNNGYISVDQADAIFEQLYTEIGRYEFDDEQTASNPTETTILEDTQEDKYEAPIVADPKKASETLALAQKLAEEMVLKGGVDFEKKLFPGEKDEEKSTKKVNYRSGAGNRIATKAFTDIK